MAQFTMTTLCASTRMNQESMDMLEQVQCAPELRKLYNDTSDRTKNTMYTPLKSPPSNWPPKLHTPVPHPIPNASYTLTAKQ